MFSSTNTFNNFLNTYKYNIPYVEPPTPPTDINDYELILWYDANDSSTLLNDTNIAVTISNENVITVKNKAIKYTNQFDLSTISAGQNTYQPTITSIVKPSIFTKNSSTTGFRTIESPQILNGFTVFMVFQPTGNGHINYKALFSKGTPYPIDIYNGSRFVGSSLTNTTNSGGFNIGTSQPQPILFVCNCNISSYNEYINGTTGLTFGSVQYLDSTSELLYIANRTDSATYSSIYLCEFIMYKTVLSDSSRKYLEGYLALKWGIQSLLPANHIYKGVTTPRMTPNEYLNVTVPNVVATGTFDTPTINGYTYAFSFTGTGTITNNTASNVTVNYLIVGGGGGGGAKKITIHDEGSGGGGGGKVCYGTVVLTKNITYTITIGSGGSGAVAVTTGFNGVNGSNSVFSGPNTSITAIGGGGGGSWSNIGSSGGSGGGAGGFGGAHNGGSTTSSTNSGNITITQAGNNGGNTVISSGGGGGGGAGGGGSNGVNSNNGGAGGAGYTWLNGSAYGGGGGGGNYVTASSTLNVGRNGGGNGGRNASGATSGTANTGGGGGGGAGGTNGGNAGAGGSGIVIICF
jgi:hypothetical protein